MNYTQIKKLDEDTQRDLKEGFGPVDECLCSVLAPPEGSKGLRGSIRRAFASIGGIKAGGKGARRGKTIAPGGQNSIEIPLTFDKGGKGIFTTKEQVKRASSCGKCGCDNEKFFLKHSYANIRITSPDVSSICPCPDSSCMPGKDKFNNNITVTVEHVGVSETEYDSSVSETKYKTNKKNNQKPKPMTDRNSRKELVANVWKEWKSKEEIFNVTFDEVADDVKNLDRHEEHVDISNKSEHFETEEYDKSDLKKPDLE